MSSSLFYANEIFSIQEDNLILTVNAEAIKGVLLFTPFIICIIFVFKLFILVNHETANRYEFNFHNTPQNQLFKRYTRREISFE